MGVVMMQSLELLERIKVPTFGRVSARCGKRLTKVALGKWVMVGVSVFGMTVGVKKVFT